MAGGSESNLELIIEQALELSVSERIPFLDSVCADDMTMRAELDRLLRSDSDEYDQKLRDLFRDVRDGIELGVEIPVGARLMDRFTVLRKIGAGGMADVYLVREDDFDRDLALKVIRTDLHNSERNRTRFLNEAKLLGLLQNQNIVPVHSLGELNDGRPYYAMRFVHGTTLMDAITRFHNPKSTAGDPRERVLALHGLIRRFVNVCNAVAYAHGRGVLHRDIKPANIIFGDDGEYGETFLVDWGLAKLVGPSNPDVDDQDASAQVDDCGAAVTCPGSISGTPEYMSPEQAGGDAEKVGPASDVYSLGGTLYTLLTGRPPIEDEKSVSAILQKVKAGRFPPPQVVRDNVPGALQAVCLKAMELEPQRRYPSARALAEDIEAWMVDEPISAWREPFSVRTRRWMRRHRTLVVSTVAVLACTLAGLAGFSLLVADKNRELDVRNRELDRQRAAALGQRNRALKAEQTAKDEEVKSKKSESDSRVLLEFFENKVLAAARPKDMEGGLGVDATIRAALDTAEARIEDSFADKPNVEASIRNTLGQSYLYLGEPARAIRQLERARALSRQFLGPDHTDTLDAINNLCFAFRDAGRFEDALPLLEDARKRCAANLGPDHSLTLTVMNNLAGAYREVGRLDAALLLNEETLKRRKATLGPDHADTLASMSYVARTQSAVGRHADALPLYEDTLRRRRAKLGLSHADTLLSMNDLATAYFRVGRVADALPLLEETLTQRTARLGPDHPGTLITMGNLAVAYQAAHRLTEAIPLQVNALNGLKAKLGADNPQTLAMTNGLVAFYLEARRWAEAEIIARECLVIREKKAPDDWSRFHTMSQLGAALAGQRRYPEAEPLILLSYEGLRTRTSKIPVARKQSVTEASARILALYDAWAMPDKADEWRRKLDRTMADDNFPTDPFAR
jgi:serine/threonine protein kinase